jgi:SAM-dependent methyltransferase
MNDASFFNAKAADSGAYKVYPDREYRRILEACGIARVPKGARVLDAGCGSGAFSEHLLELGLEVTGVDISEGLIRLAKTNLPGGKFLAGDIFKTGLPPGSCDAVFCGAVLHHFPGRLREAFAEFSRLLIPGGKVYFFEPYAHSVNSFLWYKVFSIDRTPGEAALAPAAVERAFGTAGFRNFSFVRVDAVENVQPAAASALGGALNAARRFVSRYLLPNTYFAGSAAKL